MGPRGRLSTRSDGGSSVFLQIHDHAGIEDAVGVEGPLDALHDLDDFGAELEIHVLLAGLAGTVLGGDGPAPC